MPAPPDNTPPSPIQSLLDSLHQRLRQNAEGEVATYIPELAKADPEHFGICLVTADGQIYQAGDCAIPFTIQSMSKPFVYGAALEDNGKAAVLQKIWVEPSGEAFNAISLRPGSGQPENPMINAGAIGATSLLEGKSREQKLRRILDCLSRYAGRELEVDQAVYLSESSTGHRNRAIGHMLRNFGIIEDDPIPSLEAYFMQCSVAVTCTDLAIMAATLANGGVNPITGARAVVRGYVENILSVMASCGMYDAAGEWIYNVGMPAKSGVAGGIFAVLPGQLGIGVYSPRLDAHGNSVRGIEACRAISHQFGLHMFNVPRPGSSVIRRSGDLARSHSRRLRSPAEREALASSGHTTLILELQGDLGFGAAEVAIRGLSSAPTEIRELIVDLAHVTSLDPSAAGVFSMAFSSWLNSGRAVSVCDSARFAILPKILRLELPDTWEQIDFFDDYSLALERAEDRLLARAGLAVADPSTVPLERCALLSGLAPADLDQLARQVTPRTFPDGDVILRAGDPPGSLFFLLSGRASAWITGAAGKGRRIATFSPGMSFGESALLDRSPRSAEVRADGEARCAELPLGAIDSLFAAGGQLPVTLLRNLSLLLDARVRDANAELSNYLP